MLTPEQRKGAMAPLTFFAGTAQPVTDRVLMGFRVRVSAFPAATRSCLLVAALDHHGGLEVLARAVSQLGASLVDFAEAERAGLVRVGPDGVAFHHPLVRTAVLLACDIGDRMAAHQALAETADDDRRAWHRAALTLQPDEEVAGELENLALLALRRGGQTAVSAAYARAAELSPDPGRAVRRWTAAAQAAIEAGLWQRAGELVTRARQRAETVTLTGSAQAELAYVRAKLEVEAGRPLDGVRLLHDGAEATDDLPSKLSLLAMAGYYTWPSFHPPRPAHPGPPYRGTVPGRRGAGGGGAHRQPLLPPGPGGRRHPHASVGQAGTGRPHPLRAALPSGLPGDRRRGHRRHARRPHRARGGMPGGGTAGALAPGHGDPGHRRGARRPASLRAGHGDHGSGPGLRCRPADVARLPGGHPRLAVGSRRGAGGVRGDGRAGDP
ncbi:hypothetical protein [Nonomuraea dietziae]|uniref:hypothetical protein n=1 Tax=Nonomuraea dietziae TaxID=65515 RepID=UPI0031DEBFE3